MLFSRSILVSNYQTDMFFYVLSLLKSLNNRIIQILNLTIKLTFKTNPIIYRYIYIYIYTVLCCSPEHF